MTAKIDSVSSRNSLPPRPAPYFQRLEQGAYIGYRKLDSNTGTWVARWRNESGKQINKTLGNFDTFDNACKTAREWIERCKGGVIEEITVEVACRRYVKDRRHAKGDECADDADGRFTRRVYGTKFGQTKLSLLRTAHIIDWRNSFSDLVDDEDDQEDVRRSRDTANRYLATLKAALNLSYRMGLVSSTAPWDRVESFKGVGKRRERFLTVVERKKLIAAATPELTRFIKALLLTGARPGEIASATVGDLDTSGLITLDGKTGRRTVPISPAALMHLKECAGERGMSEPLLALDNGHAFSRYDWRDQIQEARGKAGLGEDVVAYTLRHVAITEMIVAGIDPLSVARLAGTSIAMIQRHYGHLMKDKISAQLALVKVI